MTIIQAYERSYAQKNQAIRNQLAATKRTLQSKRRRTMVAGEEKMRQAYASYLQAATLKRQQNAAKGRHGGAGDNAVAGLGSRHRVEQEGRGLSMTQAVQTIDEQIRTETEDAARAIAANQQALQLKKDQQQIKEAQAAERAAAKAKAAAEKAAAKAAADAKKAAEKAAKEAAKAAEKAAKQAAARAKQEAKKKNQGKETRQPQLSVAQQIIERMMKGEYDKSFAPLLGWTDAQVRAYIYQNQQALKASEKKETERLPGTFKPSLH